MATTTPSKSVNFEELPMDEDPSEEVQQPAAESATESPSSSAAVQQEDEPGEVYSPAMEEVPPQQTVKGTILEAAFVDPAFSWPPADGEGKYAVELQASSSLLEEEHKEQDKEAVQAEKAVAKQFNQSNTMTTTTKTTSGWSWCGIKCCKGNDTVDTHTSTVAVSSSSKQARKSKDRERRKRERYNRVPEGILIYRLDTSTHTVELVSTPSSKTDTDTLLTRMVVAKAVPSHDKSRRAMVLTGIDGTQATITACDQRTAIAWLEAMDMMLASKERRNLSAGGNKVVQKQESRSWGQEKLNESDLDHMESQYMNLAAYSNRLIRAGVVAGQKNKHQGASIYYSVEKVQHHHSEHDQQEEEALESIAKRRAVIKDSWDFYRMICSLLRDRRKYEEVFRKMQLDPVYPYLNSMTGLNDPGDEGDENADKMVLQKDLDEYKDMTRTQVAQDLCKRAEEALPSLVEICKALAGSLGMEEVGVGPVKEVGAAILKAEKKYDGDLLKVTDYCRSLLVVKDFPALLALLELARDSFGPLIRRVKLSTLKSDHKAMPGGYRDCKINLELKGHICEIQVHLWPMWTVCGVDGFRHYRHCVEYSTDSFADPYEALDGLDRKTMAELIVMAEEAVAAMPLDNLEWYQEKYILDYFAEAGLFLYHGLEAWAEVTLRRLIQLRLDSPDIGPGHQETLILQRYLERALRAQRKNKEADEIAKELQADEDKKTDEKKDAQQSLWDSLMNAPVDALDMVMDPNKKERLQEEEHRREVKASKKQWRKIRQERFAFLDSNNVIKREQSAGERSGQGAPQ